jgi:hypothetical protein
MSSLVKAIIERRAGSSSLNLQPRLLVVRELTTARPAGSPVHPGPLRGTANRYDGVMLASGALRTSARVRFQRFGEPTASAVQMACSKIRAL